MINASKAFASEPFSSERRQVMVKAARALLSAVTRLLIIADMIDVHLLLKAAKDIKGLLEAVKSSSSQEELLKRLALLRQPLDKFHKDSARRAADLIDPYHRDDMLVRKKIKHAFCFFHFWSRLGGSSGAKNG